jgi:anti-anti-sigma factor
VSLADMQLTEHGQIMVACLTGEVDLSNAEDVRSAIVAALPNHSLALVVDLSAVDYMDSATIRLIYHLREDLHARGQALRLVVRTASPANDALRLAGVMHQIETLETVGDALQDLDSRP